MPEYNEYNEYVDYDGAEEAEYEDEELKLRERVVRTKRIIDDHTCVRGESLRHEIRRVLVDGPKTPQQIQEILDREHFRYYPGSELPVSRIKSANSVLRKRGEVVFLTETDAAKTPRTLLNGTKERAQHYVQLLPDIHSWVDYATRNPGSPQGKLLGEWNIKQDARDSNDSIRLRPALRQACNEAVILLAQENGTKPALGKFMSKDFVPRDEKE